MIGPRLLLRLRADASFDLAGRSVLYPPGTPGMIFYQVSTSGYVESDLYCGKLQKKYMWQSTYEAMSRLPVGSEKAHLRYPCHLWTELCFSVLTRNMRGIMYQVS